MSKNDNPLVISARELARELSVSVRSIHRANSAAKLPRPFRIQGCVRWDYDEIVRWIKAGCPHRKTWEEIEKQNGFSNERRLP